MASYDESERADYMSIVANIAHADRELAPEEAFILREMCMHFVLGPSARGRVLAFTVQSRAELESVLERLGQSDLKHALLADLYVMALVDGSLHESEEREIQSLASRLGVDTGALSALKAFGENACLAQKDAGKCEPLAEALKKLEQGGVPAKAVEIAAATWLLSQKDRLAVV